MLCLMSSRESFAVKMPSQPGSLLSQELGIVLLNHCGSSSRQDTGRDAQFLADRYGVMAIAADRPTNYPWPHDTKLAKRLSSAPVREMFGLAAKLDSVIDDWKVKRVVIAGRSAGGLAALELAQTEGIANATFVYAADPVGCFAISPVEGKRHYLAYLAHQKRLMKADAKLPADQREFIHPTSDAWQLPLRTQLGRWATMGTLLRTDVYYNRGHWNQNLVADYLSDLARRHGLPTHVDFAEVSLVLPPDETARKAYLDQIGTIEAGAPMHNLSMEVVPGTTHNSFDNRTFMSERLEATLYTHTGVELVA